MRVGSTAPLCTVKKVADIGTNPGACFENDFRSKLRVDVESCAKEENEMG